MKARLSVAAGILAGVCLFWYALKGVDFARLSEACRQADYALLALAVLTNLAEAFMRGVKWKLLLDPVNRVRVWDSFRMETAGLALNNVLPFRLGEILRGTAGAGVFHMPVVTVFATIVVERALDVIALVLLLSLVGISGRVEGDIFQHKSAIILLFTAVAAGICAVIFADRLVKLKILEPLFTRFVFLKKILSQIAAGAIAFKDWRRGIITVLAAMFQWCVNAFTILVLVYAFHLQDMLGPAHCIVVTVASAIACSIPAMPGFFGNYEAGVAAVMGVWGVQKDAAFAMAFTGHILGYITITLAGLIFVYGLGYSVGRVWNFRSGNSGTSTGKEIL